MRKPSAYHVIIALAGLGVTALLLWLVATRPSRTLNVLNWDFYIGNRTIPSFEEKEGIRTSYTLYASNEDALRMIRENPGVYDIVIPSDYMMDIMIKDSLLEPLDHSQVPNLTNVDPRYRGGNNYWDTSEQFCAPYLFGSTGFAVNTALFQGASGSAMSWRALENDATGPQVLRNRVAIIDDMRFVLGSILLELGHDPNTTNADQINQAVALLKRIRPLVRAYSADSPKDLLLNGDVWVAYAWNGDVLQVQRHNPGVQYMIPTAGSLRFQDGVCIPKNAPHKEMAHRFINHLLDGTVHAEIVNHTWYGSTNAAARRAIDPSVLSNPASFPPDSVVRRLHFIRDVGNAAALYERAWAEVKR